MARVRLPGVRTPTGAPVTLLFAEGGVHVLSTTGRRRLLFRVAGGAVFAAVALAAVGLGVGHGLEPALGANLTAAAVALAAAAGATATAAWMLNIRAERALRRDRTRPDIAVDQVAWARSTQHEGDVRVVVGMTEGDTHEFSAGGFTGVQLARQFGQLLEADSRRVADPASGGTGHGHQDRA